MKTQVSKVAIAEVLGTKAFNEGKKRVFALDIQASELLKGNEIGNPQNHKIMDAWYGAWDLSNLNAPI